ncbi:hypothetical protein [Luteimonas terrae]|uniref:Uncharacterized protein n=1 Tax=Luteimonas terrae TaxID=1530191 RepID=A0A4V3AND2_9GAMM|nr:hypothetical protein [Luteimonas terrae]TDK30684.1 hypothetical protein E2F49_10015 [Luteimonas terrae]
MGLLRIATVGALGYFAYRAFQNRTSAAIAADAHDDDTAADATRDVDTDDDAITEDEPQGDVTPSAGTRRTS